MQKINILGVQLWLLPQKAIYIEPFKTLLISDIHLGKSETFQAFGIPVPSTVNQATLDRLQTLCTTYQPETVIILGDLFHSKFALVDEVLQGWKQFIANTAAQVQLIVGNHDRSLIPALKKLAIPYSTSVIQIENLLLSHEPQPQPHCLNICGHIHPCVRIKTRLDNLRLPCFYLDSTQNLLILPSFGTFTGGYDVPLKPGSTAYVVVEDTVVPFCDSSGRGR